MEVNKSSPWFVHQIRNSWNWWFVPYQWCAVLILFLRLCLFDWDDFIPHPFTIWWAEAFSYMSSFRNQLYFEGNVKNLWVIEMSWAPTVLQCQLAFLIPLTNNFHVKFLLQRALLQEFSCLDWLRASLSFHHCSKCASHRIEFLATFFYLMPELEPLDKAAAWSGPGTWGLPEWLLLREQGFGDIPCQKACLCKEILCLSERQGKGRHWCLLSLPSLVGQQEQLQTPILTTASASWE